MLRKLLKYFFRQYSENFVNSISTIYRFIILCFRSKECLPYLKKSNHAHILNLSPPLSMKSYWFKNHVAYTIAKYGMSMCALGMSEEFRSFNIAVNTLWPKTGTFNNIMSSDH